MGLQIYMGNLENFSIYYEMFARETNKTFILRPTRCRTVHYQKTICFTLAGFLKIWLKYCFFEIKFG